jgi:hypothetical protein
MIEQIELDHYSAIGLHLANCSLGLGDSRCPVKSFARQVCNGQWSEPAALRQAGIKGLGMATWSRHAATGCLQLNQPG